MASSVKHLVVDSGAFIKDTSFHERAENIYSVDGAIKEIKDKVTRQRLQVLPYDLTLREPNIECFKYVVDFSKKTGDYFSLSATDLSIIALTYQLEKEYVGTDHLNKEPTCQVTGNSATPQHVEGFFYDEKGDDDEISVENDEFSEKCCISDEDPTDDSKKNSSSVDISDKNDVDIAQNDSSIKDADNGDIVQNISSIKDGDNLQIGNSIDDENTSQDDDSTNDGSDEEDDDDGGGWITPGNLREVQRKMGNASLDAEQNLTVACITTDFAIQNVLLQMGLHVMSVDGMLIKNLRMFILRCYACFKTTTKITKSFCPNCGNQTLKRVAVSVDEEGMRKVHINFRRPINVRGTKFSLPTPKGGKHSHNPIVCADQPIPHNRPKKSALTKMDVLSADFVPYSSPFAIHDVYSRAAALGIRGQMQPRTRRNPNECTRRTGNRKNKKNC